MKPFSLGLLFLCPFLSFGHAQEFSRITKVEIVYGQALRSGISQTIQRYSKDDLTLDTLVIPAGAPKNKPIHSTRTKLEESDLSNLIRFFNDELVRKEFLKLPASTALDGGGLNVTVTEGSLSLTFSTREPFEEKAGKQEKELSRIAGKFFNLAGLASPPVIAPEKQPSSSHVHEIPIPEFSVTSVSIEAVMLKLQERALAADPEKKGISYVFDPSVNLKEIKKITFSVKDVPVYDIVRVAASLSGLEFETVGRTYVLSKKEED